MPGEAVKNLARAFKLSPFKIGCLMVFLACLLFYSFGQKKPELLSSLDNQISSAMFRWRGPQATTGQVVIVDIDEKSLREIGQWPWPRNIVARLVSGIHAAGAHVMGFDIVFAEKDRTGPGAYLDELKDHPLSNGLRQELATLAERDDLDHDRMLGETVAGAPLVLGYIMQLKNDGMKKAQEKPLPACMMRVAPQDMAFKNLNLIPCYRPILNIEDIAQAPTEGFLNVFPDTSGMVRKVPVLMELDGIAYPSLALEMVRMGMGEQELVINASTQKIMAKNSLIGVNIKDRFIPTDDMGQVTVNFRGPVGSFQYISAADILKGRVTDKLRGKYVIIGSSASGLLDFHATPFSSIFPGEEIQATVIDNMLAGDLFTYDIFTEIGLSYTFIIVGGIILSALLAYSGAIAGGTAGVLFLAGMVLADYRLFFLKGQLLGLTYPLASVLIIFLSVTLFNYFFEYRKKQFIHEAFSRYVSPVVVSQLMRKPERLSLSGEQKNLTILFSDIRNFTTISEGMDAQSLGTFMNSYLTAMSDVVMQHGGMVDKYIGDAIMAIWGAPLADEDHMIHAVRASIAMQGVVKSIRGAWTEQGLPAIEISIGINTGPVSVGNFGSERRFEYTVLGDHVNLASRLEGLNKVYGTGIIISGFTRQELGSAFFCRELDRVRVKGKSIPIEIYEPLCEGPVDTALRHEVQCFEQALSLYRNQDFESARRILEDLQQIKPHQLYALYLERIKTFLENPPGPGWDGATTFTNK